MAGWRRTPQQVRVIESRPRDHVATSTSVPATWSASGIATSSTPSCIWCASEDGHQGWVAESYLEITGDKEAVATCEYDAAQLTVIEGEVLEVLDRQGAFLLCRNAAGTQGWVPRRVLEDVAPGDS